MKAKENSPDTLELAPHPMNRIDVTLASHTAIHTPHRNAPTSDTNTIAILTSRLSDCLQYKETRPAKYPDNCYPPEGDGGYRYPVT